jgi:hypothetical protein
MLLTQDSRKTKPSDSLEDMLSVFAGLGLLLLEIIRELRHSRIELRKRMLAGGVLLMLVASCSIYWILLQKSSKTAQSIKWLWK